MQGQFGDERLNRAGQSLYEAMLRKQSVSLRRLGQGRAAEVRYGRFLQNKRVTVDKLEEGVCRGLGPRCAGQHVLLIQDTSELNYQAHAGRVKGLGTVGNGSDAGLFVHPVLAVQADEGACLGLAHLHLWQRTRAKTPGYRDRGLPIEEKESRRWVDAARRAGERTAEAAMVTVVADRESDIYEMWDRLPDERTHLLIRACRDRALPGQQERLFAWLSGLPEQGRYQIEVTAQTHPPRSARQADVRVRFGQTHIMRPRDCTDKEAAPQLSLWAIEVQEEAGSAPTPDEAIHWRLLTTHAVRSLADARRCIEWYRQRWHIEQVFRTLKRQGLNVESSLLEEAPRLEKLAVMATSVAVQTMQLTLARDGAGQRPASDCFDAQDQPLLEQVNATLQGKTIKQQNPHPQHSLAWAAWIVARLGGWKGYASERKPGPITMLRGLQDLDNIRRGWAIARLPG
jgi:hypothetical protein